MKDALAHESAVIAQTENDQAISEKIGVPNGIRIRQAVVRLVSRLNVGYLLFRNFPPRLEVEGEYNNS